MKRSTLAVLLAACTGTAGVIALAGPLDPPAGPITSTNKTLSEVQPRIAINAVNTPTDGSCLYRISKPGSYYLTGNLKGVAGKHGIKIDSHYVTVDLMGFTLEGVDGSLDGVTCDFFGGIQLAVRNGILHSWGGSGVDIGSHDEAYSELSDLKASDCGGDGLHAGYACLITRCIAASNNGTGIECESGGVITQCASSWNNYGFSIGDESVITDCTAALSANTGITGSYGITISGCTSRANTGYGFSMFSDSTIRNCVARANHNDGIIAISGGCNILSNQCIDNGTSAVAANIHTQGDGSRVEGNTCQGADIGMQIQGTGNVVIKNTCKGNTLNWSISANNIFGPIIDRTAPGSPAITGNSATGTMGSTDSNANFTH